MGLFCGPARPSSVHGPGPAMLSLAAITTRERARERQALSCAIAEMNGVEAIALQAGQPVLALPARGGSRANARCMRTGHVLQ